MAVVSLLPVYFTGTVVGPDGITLLGRHFHPDSLWAFMIGFADVLAFLAAPVLGAMADFSSARRRFLLAFAYGGALFTTLLFFSRSGDVVRTIVFFVISQFAFVSANVFYDAFLPHIASDETMDWVSGKGYSYGYLGGGLQFALALAIVLAHEQLGITQQTAMRLGLAMAGLWWAGFTLFTARYLRERPAAAPLPSRFRRLPKVFAVAAIGVSRTLATTRHAGRFRHLLLVLLAFMLYNDGIQTVINLATSYGSVELRLPASVLMLTLLAIQFVAIGGALLFGYIARRIGPKRAIMITLGIWSGVVIYAYFIRTAAEFMALGAVVGLVLGGSQALSRSFFGSMIPAYASAEFFGFYTVFTKFSSIWGPLAFGVIKQTTGSSRLAILSLIAFFLLGLLLLSLVNDDKARQAKTAGAF
jgi:UMF1 family MFS transporter